MAESDWLSALAGSSGGGSQSSDKQVTPNVTVSSVGLNLGTLTTANNAGAAGSPYLEPLVAARTAQASSMTGIPPTYLYIMGGVLLLLFFKKGRR